MGRWGYSKDPPLPPILYFVQESSPGRMRSFLALFNNLCGFQLEYFIKDWVCCWGFFFSPPLGNETLGDVPVSAACYSQNPSPFPNPSPQALV